jgi:hypothetical protein
MGLPLGIHCREVLCSSIARIRRVAPSGKPQDNASIREILNKTMMKQQADREQPLREQTDSPPEPLPNERADERPREFGGRKGPEPTRYGDWEKNGRCIDF